MDTNLNFQIFGKIKFYKKYIYIILKLFDLKMKTKYFR
ncbi:hypothetical protein LEP1GSC127_2882 [Leptospira kirschneri str. 200801925]|uniref:Uncharacterized protein n=1 Tax=Leptospira kirschneri str. 200802841 TaxID=1193047 RepID=A0A828Y3K7_9LEPT|nr:hypothetical protein LEP1GSC044_2898 [Leptospira kirschneri serovar Grippotyphosa str. RM52]EKO51393.1 hypothetical protein LEP1GSC131_2108 [Leptospira kirschneri str. 200802841]EKQ82846.1 hypothetical protein LEP1GSC064_1974 [Leptospira kirschneri serovar Grippotyphosa str. Moskva]EKR07620.1 hypothetical protein LEP1GSC122_2606 [Leptospira kirschneri serovar Valbuzzi str. 200702274]EMK00786.1 hypothetical protein LEP1GSC176_3740 [Leptospira kirschneri str. MMD1493]EMO75246.1 hypothetical p